MKGGTQAALALGVGYVLGRRRRMRMTTMLAAAAATGGIGGLGGAALRRGFKMLGSSELLGDLGPQLNQITETVRSDLMDAGKAAALAAVNNRIGSLSDSLHDRAETLRKPGASVTDAATGAGDAVRGAGKRKRRAAGGDDAGQNGRGRSEPSEPEDEYEDEPEDEYEDEPEDEPDEEPDDGSRAAPVKRRRAPRKSPVSRARG